MIDKLNGGTPVTAHTNHTTDPLSNSLVAIPFSPSSNSGVAGKRPHSPSLENANDSPTQTPKEKKNKTADTMRDEEVQPAPKTKKPRAPKKKATEISTPSQQPNVSSNLHIPSSTAVLNEFYVSKVATSSTSAGNPLAPPIFAPSLTVSTPPPAPAPIQSETTMQENVTIPSGEPLIPILDLTRSNKLKKKFRLPLKKAPPVAESSTSGTGPAHMSLSIPISLVVSPATTQTPAKRSLLPPSKPFKRLVSSASSPRNAVLPNIPAKPFPLYHFDFESSFTTPAPPSDITRPPRLSLRVQTNRLAVILSMITDTDRRHCVLVCKTWRYAGGSYDILLRSFLIC